MGDEETGSEVVQRSLMRLYVQGCRDCIYKQPLRYMHIPLSGAKSHHKAVTKQQRSDSQALTSPAQGRLGIYLADF